jgi:hypothetical protein
MHTQAHSQTRTDRGTQDCYIERDVSLTHHHVTTHEEITRTPHRTKSKKPLQSTRLDDTHDTRTHDTRQAHNEEGNPSIKTHPHTQHKRTNERKNKETTKFILPQELKHKPSKAHSPHDAHTTDEETAAPRRTEKLPPCLAAAVAHSLTYPQPHSLPPCQTQSVSQSVSQSLIHSPRPSPQTAACAAARAAARF